jgi:hypothetical protein
MPDASDLLAALESLTKGNAKPAIAKGSGWLSRKLTIGAAVLAGFFILAITGRLAELAAILWPVATVTCTWLIVQGWEDTSRIRAESLAHAARIRVEALAHAGKTAPAAPASPSPAASTASQPF